MRSISREYPGGVINVEQRSELPPGISKLVELAFSQYPELKHAKVETFPPTDDFDAGGFYEFEEDQNGNPVPKICISEGDEEMLKPLLEIRKSSIEINAEMLGIDPKDMTPKLLQYFIIAHELGHIRDFEINFKDDPDLNGWDAVEEMAYQRDAVLAMLPVPNLSPTHLARELEGMAFIDVVSKFPALRDYPGFADLGTVEELLAEQEREYRTSAPELYADKFAAEFLRLNAQQLGLSQLQGYPLAA